jgi:drug/metabolite transporter (DMT)-like permease
MVVYKIALGLCLILGVLAQLSLKKGVNQANAKRGKGLMALVNMFLNVFVIFGFLFYGLSSFSWIVALSKLDLSYAYPIVSFSYVLVALASVMFLGEKVSKKRWMSIALITVGVVLVGLS